MKQFLINNIVFVFLLMLLSIYLHGVIDKYYYKNYDKVDLNYNKYVFSDSRGLPFKSLEEYDLFNFSAGSESYFDIERKLNYLLDNNVKIDTIYLNVDSHALSSYREKLNNTDKSKYYITHEHYGSYTSYLLDVIFPRYIVLFNKKYNAFLSAYFFKSTNKKVNNNKNWFDRNEVTRKEDCKNRFNQQYESCYYSLKLEKTLNSIFNICRSNDISVIGIKYPIDTYYNSLVRSHFFEQKMDSILKVNQLYIEDYSSSNEFSLKDFANQDHLTSKAAKKLAKLIFK